MRVIAMKGHVGDVRKAFEKLSIPYTMRKVIMSYAKAKGTYGTMPGWRPQRVAPPSRYTMDTDPEVSDEKLVPIWEFTSDG